MNRWILQLTHQVARVAAVTEAILPITSLRRSLKRKNSPAVIFPRFEQSCPVVKSNGVGGDDLVWLVVDLDLVGLVVELVRLVVDIVGLAVMDLVGLVGLVVDLVRGWVDHVGLVVVELGFLVGLVVNLVVELVGLGVDHPLIVRAAAERLASECC